MAVPLKIADRKLFVDLLTRRSGLHVPRDELERFDQILRQRAEALGCKSILGYYNLLENSPQGPAEFKELVKLFTVGETYFFRSRIQFRALRQVILPQIVESRKKAAGENDTALRDPQSLALSMNLWSAGCATGEEAYSIAITVEEALPGYQYWKLRIAGTDINEDALDHARAALYDSHSLRGVSEQYIRNYFQKDAGGYRLVEEIRRMVELSYLNLADPYFPSPFGVDGAVDLIFCRNVLMYFERPIAEDILYRFFELLRPGGYLMLGTAEAVTDDTIGFERIAWEDAYFYRKPPGAVVPEHREATGESFPFRDYIPGAGPPVEEPTTETRETTRLRGAFTWLKASLERNPNDPMTHFQIAKLYADRGTFQMAMDECERALEVNPFFALSYLLLGILHFRSEEFEMALENLRRALYNDKTLILARYYLAQTLRATGETKRALAEFKAVASDLEKKPPREIVYQSDGFTHQALLDVVRREARTLQESLNSSS